MNAAFAELLPAFNRRDEKPGRAVGLTEIRGPYYSAYGTRHLEDLLEVAGAHIDCLKFAGGSFMVMPEAAVRAMTDMCHQHQVKVSTGGFLERVLVAGAGERRVASYMDTCKALGFDVLEVSAGFITLPQRDWERLVEEARDHGLQPKAEVGIQWGAGGTTPAAALAAEGTRDVRQLLSTAGAFAEMGVPLMIESEGITEQVSSPRYDVAAAVAAEIGLERVMFEAADPDVFAWYVKTFGPDVNLFVDHSQVLQLECLRRGLWGPSDVWGRVVTYRGKGGGGGGAGSGGANSGGGGSS